MQLTAYQIFLTDGTEIIDCGYTLTGTLLRLAAYTPILHRMVASVRGSTPATREYAEQCDILIDALEMKLGGVAL